VRGCICVGSLPFAVFLVTYSIIILLVMSTLTSSLVQLAHKYWQGIDGLKQDDQEAQRLYQLRVKLG
jgi:hypothetical protein